MLNILIFNEEPLLFYSESKYVSEKNQYANKHENSTRYT